MMPVLPPPCGWRDEREREREMRQCRTIGDSKATRGLLAGIAERLLAKDALGLRGEEACKEREIKITSNNWS